MKVYDAQARHLRRAFRPYGTRRCGVRVAVGDVNGDGRLDVITAPGSGVAPHVKVFDGLTGRALGGFLALQVIPVPAFEGYDSSSTLGMILSSILATFGGGRIK